MGNSRGRKRRMKRIILEDVIFQDLDGKELPHGKAGIVISDMLISGSGKDAIKQFLLAQRFRKCENIELDEADIKLIYGIAESTTAFTVLAKAQTLLLLDNAVNIN